MITFTVPVPTPNPSNGSRGMSRGAAMGAARLRKRQRHTAFLAALGAVGQPRPRFVVTLVRVSAGVLDDDNLRTALKGVRDGVAEALGADDGRGLIRWQYAQRKGPAKQQSVEVEVETLP